MFGVFILFFLNIFAIFLQTKDAKAKLFFLFLIFYSTKKSLPIYSWKRFLL